MNIGTLLMLIIYIYSVVGVAMFGTVQRAGILTDQVRYTNLPKNFTAKKFHFQLSK